MSAAPKADGVLDNYSPPTDYPIVKNYSPDTVKDDAAYYKSVLGGNANLRQGTNVAYPSDSGPGSVLFTSVNSDITDGEILFAFDAGYTGQTVEILGPASAGVDFKIGGELFQLATVSTNNATTIGNTITNKVDTGTFIAAGAALLIDVRSAGGSAKVAQDALNLWANNVDYKQYITVVPITIYTNDGPVQFLNGSVQ